MSQKKDFNIEVVDRYPLVSHKVPDTVERNNQFYINQGPVDMSIISAKETSTPISFVNPLVGTYLPRNVLNQQLDKDKFSPEHQKQSFWEQYIWHPFTTKAEDFIEFSTNPTTY